MRTQAGSVPAWALLPAIALFAVLSTFSAGADAQRTERQGKEVVDAVCGACHAAGKDGAPRIGDANAWASRASQGLTALTDHALKGIRKMPAHGGNKGVSDIEIERAIVYMVNQSGGNWVEPVGGATPAVVRTSETIVQAQCAKCHQTGRGRRAEDRRPPGVDAAPGEGAGPAGRLGRARSWADAVPRRDAGLERRGDPRRHPLHVQLRLAGPAAAAARRGGRSASQAGLRNRHLPRHDAGRSDAGGTGPGGEVRCGQGGRPLGQGLLPPQHLPGGQQVADAGDRCAGDDAGLRRDDHARPRRSAWWRPTMP